MKPLLSLSVVNKGFFLWRKYKRFLVKPRLFSKSDGEVPFCDLVTVAVTTAGQHNVSRPVYTTILSGLERVVVSGVISSPSQLLDMVVKLATDLMTDWPASAVVPAVQLFLAAMYSSHSPLNDVSHKPSPITDPEMLMLMMEQMSILFDCVRRLGPLQAELLAEILPQVLLDFFPASDVVNRVITEFISPGQPHLALLAGVLRQIFQAAATSCREVRWVSNLF